ncbi:hypothetical protein ABK040_002333 [Willaertia magna]
MKNNKVYPLKPAPSAANFITEEPSFSTSITQKPEEDDENDGWWYSEVIENVVRLVFSLKVFIMLIVFSLVVFTAFSIWITSYLMNSEASIESSNMITKVTLEKVSTLLAKELILAKKASNLMAFHYHSKLLDENNPEPLRIFQYSMLHYFQISNLNLALGNVEGVMSNTHVLLLTEFPCCSYVWYQQNSTSNFLYSYDVDMESGEITKYRDRVYYNVSSVDYYYKSIELFKTYPEGGFGDVYSDITGSVSLYYSTPVYNQTLWPKEKKLIGISKANYLLRKIFEYLSTVRIMDTGYIVVSEYKTNYLIGASLAMPPRNIAERPHAYNLTDRNAGLLMKELDNRRVVDTNGTAVSIVVLGTPYLVCVTEFQFENIKWKMTVVIEENEVKKTVLRSTYIILGVSAASVVVGILFSGLISVLISIPFNTIQRELKKIEVLDLDKVETSTSIFTEMKAIYSSINETVVWLKEFKSFIPESILSKANENSNDKGGMSKDTATNASAYSSLVRGMSKSSRRSLNGVSPAKINIFGVGFIPQYCTVMCITFPQFKDFFGNDEQEFSSLISNIVVNVSTFSKLFKAECQMKSVDEYLIFFTGSPNETIPPLEFAIKLKNNLSPFSYFEDPLIVCFGFAYGKILKGNVGNSQVRYPAQFGKVIKKAKDLSTLNTFLKTDILVDEEVCKRLHEQYLFLPVDRYRQGDSSKTENIYKYVRRNEVFEDEWMYELEKKKEIDNIVAFANKFVQIFSLDTSLIDLRKLQDDISELQKEIPTIDDMVIDGLSQLIDDCINLNVHPSNYFATVKREMTKILAGKRI